MYFDLCEVVFDKFLLYESGWNKKFNYVFVFVNDGVYDVMKWYI